MLTSTATAREVREPHSLFAQLPEQIELEIEYPPEGSVVNGSACGVFVAGRALVHRGESPRLDAVIVIDTSRSTVEASGADLNGNGVVGAPRVERQGVVLIERNSDPGDSILAAEVAAARLLLQGLDMRRTRVAVVTFAGEAPNASPQHKSATTVVPLTFDQRQIDLALMHVLGSSPSGRTDMAAGLKQAVHELQFQRSASSPNPGSERVVVFFTDGQPTLPFGPEFKRRNILAVFDAADAAARAGIRIESFAVGSDALEGPVAVVEMAARTGGSFTPVPRPGDLVELVKDLSFTGLRDVTVRNITTGAAARPFRLAADGSWIGFVQMDPGLNRIELMARAGDAVTKTRTLEVHLDPAKPPPAPLPIYVVQRNELLEVCLRDARHLRLSLEERAVRKELRLEIERARERAHERAATQRKELKLTVEE
jgi:hypothetical protein